MLAGVQAALPATREAWQEAIRTMQVGRRMELPPSTGCLPHAFE